MKQQSLTSLIYEGMKKRTKHEKFLNEMDQLIPLESLEGLFEPHYPRRECRPPLGLNLMLRNYWL